MAAGVYDITIEKGATFSMIVTMKDSLGVPIDLTGYTGDGGVKLKATDTAEIGAFTVTLNNPATDGVVNVSMAASTTSTLPTKGASYKDKTEAAYDIKLTKSGTVLRVLNGLAYIVPEVTE